MRLPHWVTAALASLTAALVLAGCGGGPRSTGAVAAPGSPKAKPKPPTVCPLTGLRPRSGAVPMRPALAIKVENLPAARPQSGLDTADLVYEEPVEGGITRFIVVYQCGNAAKVEPVRSGRLVDPDILVQLGHPLLAYAGAIAPVVAKIDASGLVDLSFSGVAGSAYSRDPARYAPHNLVTSTAALWQFGHGPAPAPIFTFATTVPSGQPATQVQVDFSPYSDVLWRYDASSNSYLRYYNNLQTPATVSDGAQLSATNVIVQAVQVSPSPYVEDPTGTHENYVTTTGTGTVLIFRNGEEVRGTWHRASLHAVTTYLDAQGKPIALAPGRTWVELIPAGHPVIPSS
jgi:hypothetical protein